MPETVAVDPGTKAMALENRRESLENSIRQLHTRIAKSVFSIGKALVTLRDNIIPKGDWRSYMEGSQERFGFSTATGYRYIEQYEEATHIPATKLAALESKGLDPARPAVLA